MCEALGVPTLVRSRQWVNTPLFAVRRDVADFVRLVSRFVKGEVRYDL
jgi:hypothetical protein